MNAFIIIPTRNPGLLWSSCLSSIDGQKYFVQGLVVDSSSTDGTECIALPTGWRRMCIPASDFGHGKTRNMALQFLPSNIDIVVFMTQDAILADTEVLHRIILEFNDPTVACAYGRQLPHFKANPLATHSRAFNYPAASRTLSMADQPQLGLKTCFFSNSFAAYRLADLMAVGGFPPNAILGEDMSVAARLLMTGKRVAYVAEACVYHSHNYTLAQEFRRYFDIGVFHARSPWLMQAFGGADGEGMRFVCSELTYVWRYGPVWISISIGSIFAKWLGYKLGRIESYLPVTLKRWCSMHKGYWSKVN